MLNAYCWTFTPAHCVGCWGRIFTDFEQHCFYTSNGPLTYKITTVVYLVDEKNDKKNYSATKLIWVW